MTIAQLCQRLCRTATYLVANDGAKVIRLWRDIRRRALAMGADAIFDKTLELDQFLAYCQASRLSTV
jgi:hypothetical protein